MKPIKYTLQYMPILSGITLMCLFFLSSPIALSATVSQYNSDGNNAYARWSGASDDNCSAYLLDLSSGEISSHGGTEGTATTDAATIGYYYVNSCTKESASWFGFTFDGVKFTSNTGLSRAGLSGAIAVVGWYFDGNTYSNISDSVAVDVTWIGSGPITKASLNDRYVGESGMTTYRGVGSSRDGSAWGSVMLGNGPNLASEKTQDAALTYSRGINLFLQR